MGRTACTEPQCLYKGALYLTCSSHLINDDDGDYDDDDNNNNNNNNCLNVCDNSCIYAII
jgi:hypothetical protein